MKVLLLEDDKGLAGFIVAGLKAEGMSVVWTRNGTEALQQVQDQGFDALVLDIMVPGRDGLSIVRHLRQAGHGVPIIIISARTALEERLEGLKLGADDYMTKPFSVEELAVRLHNQQRRSAGNGQAILAHGRLSINLLTRVVTVASRPVELTAREYDLLVYLARHPGRVRTRSQILEQVWEYHHEPGTNVVDVCVRRLRSKIESLDEPPIIETVRSVGYCLGKPP